MFNCHRQINWTVVLNFRQVVCYVTYGVETFEVAVLRMFRHRCTRWVVGEGCDNPLPEPETLISEQRKCQCHFQGNYRSRLSSNDRKFWLHPLLPLRNVFPCAIVSRCMYWIRMMDTCNVTNSGMELFSCCLAGRLVLLH